MPSLSSPAQLQDLRNRLIASRRADRRPTIIIGTGTASQASGANGIQRLVKRHILKRDLVDRIALRITGDLGFCAMAPYVLTEPQGALYVHVGPGDVPRIIDAVLAGETVDELLYRDPATGTVYRNHNEIPFVRKQQRTLLGKNQRLDPIRLFNYLGIGGYGALQKALSSMTPEEVIDEVKRSGLRGRGGAGFPTGMKWSLAGAQGPSNGRVDKYVVCNADEGDPGAYMDRGLLEGNPHSVIEGMILGGYAMGASEGFIYVRHEYPLAIKNTIIALRGAHHYGLLGKDILGTGFDFDIQIVKGAGAFVCGEETALIRSIEGMMGEPRQRPPYPIERGIFGRPTCINNVETWTNIPEIINGGGEAFAEVGTPSSTGTKVFSVVGKVRNSGLFEVPMGITIGEIVHDIGGGPAGDDPIKAVQIGGPSGGCIPARRFDLPIDYDSLKGAGAIMGSGGMIVMDESTCMVDVAKYFMNFLRDESCGKCLTCRDGTQRLYEILEDISVGAGTLEQLELLEELARVVQDTTMCGLGQSAPNPVLSTLRYFRSEYERHIVDKRCDAYVCKKLVGAPCQATCPIGTEAWRYVAHIAHGEFDQAYLAIRQHNPFPSICARVCSHPCEGRCRRGQGDDQPVAIRALKRFVTDQADPRRYRPERAWRKDERVAVVGAGPGGLAAAHDLSLLGYRVTVFEAEDRPGGMLATGVPEYRLPRDVLQREIDALLDDESITLECGKALGRDLSLDSLVEQGFGATFLALGAHRSRKLGVEAEHSAGVHPSIHFLRAWNLRRESLAKGRVGVIGGGNSAVDAARVARRQPGVEHVTIYYRRTRREMPAFADEIDAALEEGIRLEVLVAPSRIHTEGGRITGLGLVRNDLGEVDTSGRRRPVPREGSDFVVPLDTLVVAIGEQTMAFDATGSEGLEFSRSGGLAVDPRTLQTARPGVFAGGDVVTGPNTVVDAIAAGKRAARTIDRYLRGVELDPPAEPRLPGLYIELASSTSVGSEPDGRARPPTATAEERTGGFAEVERTFGQDEAVREAHRCLRCDLEFTEPLEPERESDPAHPMGAQAQQP